MSNMQVIKTSKLVDNINIDLKKYHSIEVFTDSENLKVFFYENKLSTNNAFYLALFKLVFLIIKIMIPNINSILQTSDQRI